ncbi:MAG: hypothetical protein SFU98_12710 [Leptospiraceae bacterium]|nr:hypothetical protein [Leptospiraceae bacterium]
MAVSKEQKAEFDRNITDFKNYIEELKKETNFIKAQMKKSKDLEPYYQIALVLSSIRLMNTCVLINRLSSNIMNLKSELYLNIARKEIYSVLSSMEKVFGKNFEDGLDDNRELLEKVTLFNPKQRLNFLLAFRQTIYEIIEAYEAGAGSKWKWSFPDIHFQLAVLAKNMMDFRALERESDLENPYYYVRREHYDLIIELANKAAQEFRAKFEFSTKDVSDLRKSVNTLEMIRQIYQLTGRMDDLVRTKNIIDAQNAKIASMEEDKTKKKKK